MDEVEEIMLLAERVVLHVRHEIPPEVEVMDRLEKLIAKVRKNRGIPSPVSRAITG
jgi:hypothetical protein